MGANDAANVFGTAVASRMVSYRVAVMLAASSSFVAPFEPACILVSGPGKYRFSDYLRTGSGLSILVALIVWMLVPVMWPLD